MTPDERRSARLLFAGELAGRLVDEATVLGTSEVRDAVRAHRLPSWPSRQYQRVLMKRGKLGFESHSLAPMVRARRAVLGEAASAPPRFLVRVDEFPHWQAWDEPSAYGTERFRHFHQVMRAANVPYLIAVTPTVPRRGSDPAGTKSREHDAGERAVLAALREDPGMSFGVHGLDHRTRDAHPRRFTELAGRSAQELGLRLDRALGLLAEQELPARVLVPPFNTFDAQQWPTMASRFDVVGGGPESVGRLGFHASPLFRGRAVFLPSSLPFYGTAGQVLPGIERVAGDAAGVWIPIVLHWGWEADREWTELERLCEVLGGGGLARPWSEFLAAAELARAEPVPG